MTLTLYLADLATPEVSLWDFHDPTGANNPGGIKTEVPPNTFRLGGRRSAVEVIKRQRVARDPEAETTTFNMRAWGASTHEELRERVGEMLRLLDSGRYVLVYRPPTATTDRYLRVLGANSEDLLRGRKFDTLIDDAEGLPIEVVRDPFFLGPLLDSDTNKAPNPFLLIDSNDDGTPDGYTFDATTNVTAQSIQPSRESFFFRLTSQTQRILTGDAYDENASIAGQTWCVSLEAMVSGVARVAARIEFLNAAGAVVGAATAGVLATPSEFPDPAVPSDRLFVTAVAPAGAEQVRPSVVCENSAPGDGDYDLRRVQVEQAATPSRFVANTQVVTNDPAQAFGRLFPTFVHGDAEAPLEVTYTPSAGKVEEVVVGYRGSGGRDGGNSLADLFNRAGVVQFSGTADTDHSGGARGVAARKTITDNLDSLRGTWLALLRAASAAANQDVLLRWGPSLLDPEPETNDKLTGLVATREADVNLGRVVIPEEGDLAGIALNVENISSFGGANGLDYLMLVPTDRLSTLYVPPVARNSRLGLALTNKTTARAAIGATSLGSADGNDRILDANDECAAWTFGVLAAGHYRVTFRYSVRDRGAAYDMKWSVEDVTAAAAVTIINHTNVGDSESDVTVTVDFDADGVKSYEALAWLDVAGGATVTVHEIIREFVPYVAAGEKLRADPEWGPHREARVAKLDADEAVLVDARLAAGGVPLRADPGLGACYLAAYDVRAGNQDTELESVLGRSGTVRTRYYPRYLL